MDQAKTGRFIAQLRKEKGLTQQQLADLLNLSNKTISKWESGTGCPDVSNLPALADALGVTVDELLRGERREPAAAQTPAPPTDAPAPDAPPSNTPPPNPPSRGWTPEQKRERAIIALFASIGAILGILAYHFGWLG